MLRFNQSGVTLSSTIRNGAQNSGGARARPARWVTRLAGHTRGTRSFFDEAPKRAGGAPALPETRMTRSFVEKSGRYPDTEKASTNQSRPQIMATEVVRLPPMLKVRNFFAPGIWCAPDWLVSC